MKTITITAVAALCRTFVADIEINPVLIGVILGALFIGVIIYHIIDQRKRNRKMQESWDKLEESPMTEYHVNVTDMTCDVESFGYSRPVTEKIFRVMFLTDDGEKIVLDVDEETYLSLNVGESGMLAIVNEKFYGFVPD